MGNIIINKLRVVVFGCMFLTLIFTPPSFGGTSEFSVLRVEFDPKSIKKGESLAPVRDIYLSGGEDDGLGLSMILDVYRRKIIEDQNRGNKFEISIMVGKVKVISVFKEVAIARTIALTSSHNTPVLKYRAVMTGDFAIPAKSQIISRAEDMKSQATLLPSKLLFELNDWELKKEAKSILLTVHEMFNKSKDKKIIIAGHTCSLGSEKNNMELSKKRAQSVADYLVKIRGIPRNNIHIKYYGEKFPLASNNFEAGRSMNRRVEITFLPPGANHPPDETLAMAMMKQF